MSQQSSHGMKKQGDERSHSVTNDTRPSEGEAASLDDNQANDSGVSAREDQLSAGTQSEHMDELPNTETSSSIVGHVRIAQQARQTTPAGSEIQEDDGHMVRASHSALNEVDDQRTQTPRLPAEALPSAIGSNEEANTARFVSFAQPQVSYSPSPDLSKVMRENNLFASTMIAEDGSGWSSRRRSPEQEEIEQSLAHANKTIAEKCAKSLHAAARFGDVSNLRELLNATAFIDPKVIFAPRSICTHNSSRPLKTLSWSSPEHPEVYFPIVHRQMCGLCQGNSEEH
jgi:hypothetical protein